MTGDAETYLAGRVLNALLREDYGDLSRRIVDGALCLPGGRLIRLRSSGFLADQVVDDEIRLAEVLEAIRWLAHPADRVTAFERECRETLAMLRLHESCRDEVLARLAGLPRHGATTWYDTLAAYEDHPVYPTARCRLGLGEADVRAYGPEFHRSFQLRWTTVPTAAVTATGEHPSWWPRPGDVGLSDRDAATGELLPVHPLTAKAGVLGPRLAPEPYLEVTPTLSMRTMAVDARTHLKVPLPTSTLGMRNRRSIVPGTLADGALVQRILAAILAREPRLRVLLADERTYGHADHPYLGYLVRRFPPEVEGAHVVPVAALLARTPDGRYVIEELTANRNERDINERGIAAFFRAYLDALFTWHVCLYVRYGIALEAHQQNMSVVVGAAGAAGGTDLALLVKDNDGALLDPARLTAALGPDAPDPADFIDQRLLTNDRAALARVFITITVHLCAGAIAFGLAERGLLPEAPAMVRDRLAAALTSYPDPFLRARTLDADRLPSKAMVTAGTLVDKARIGARDINKHYGPPGPNYLSGVTATCR